ncbi:SDR family oxidoreductase [Nocardioides sp.]|uniref:SDR family oxidoreductase n=1 Tax=Nocardioides sp. TaxID=35761 RepID=UPI001A31C122|nr:SDR family oxidoreductase [Nocardioides sp.]MBJ7358902.1 SDR family oxidoreductase [Nocardioides sp.]
MTLLVTGTSGHLGRLTVHALLARGVEPSGIVATARSTEAVKDLADLGVETRVADYDDPASLAAALAGVDRVLLVSGTDVGNRVAQHRNVVDAAAEAGVSLIGYTSILGGTGTGLALAADHGATEDYLADSGLPHVLLRNGWYLENYHENTAVPLQLGTVYGAAGDGRVSAATRADFAEAAAVVMTSDGQAGRTYELAGDTGFTMGEYAAALSSASGREITYTDLPADEYAAALVAGGVPAPFADVLADSDRGIARGALEDTSGTLSRLIGRPTTSLAQALGTVA